MCGRYTPITENEIVAVRAIIRDISIQLSKAQLDDYGGISHEVAPTDQSPVIIDEQGTPVLEHAKFGFERWDGKGVIINARSETVTEKTMFKHYVQKGRCVIPTSGYFEWTPVEGKKKKAKHQIKDKQGNMLFMAGLYRNGNEGREFVIITKDPVGEIVDIHDRMPVVLRVDQIEPWLSGDLPIEALSSMDYECIGELCDQDVINAESTKQLSLFDVETDNK